MPPAAFISLFIMASPTPVSGKDSEIIMSTSASSKLRSASYKADATVSVGASAADLDIISLVTIGVLFCCQNADSFPGFYMCLPVLEFSGRRRRQ